MPRRECKFILQYYIVDCREGEVVVQCNLLFLQGAGGGRAFGARFGDEKEKIQQQRQMRSSVRTSIYAFYLPKTGHN